MYIIVDPGLPTSPVNRAEFFVCILIRLSIQLNKNSHRGVKEVFGLDKHKFYHTIFYSGAEYRK